MARPRTLRSFLLLAVAVLAAGALLPTTGALRDARLAFERHGIGWALWGWDDGFGLDAKAYGTDLAVIDALGLTPLPDPVPSPAP